MLVSDHSRWLSRTARIALLIAASICTGCVTVYQPMTSLQRPVVLDMQVENFEGTRVFVRCVPNDDISVGEAERLCGNVSSVYRNQGAKVDWEVPRNGASSRADEMKNAELVVELRTRLLHEEDSSLLRVISVASLTLIPSIAEESWSQDVTVRDGSGSLLASDSMQSRFVTYRGAGVWAVNWLLDIIVRPDAEELTGDVAKRDFSRDLYGQLSQLLFNARVRSQVLHGFDAPPPPPTSQPDKLSD